MAMVLHIPPLVSCLEVAVGSLAEEGRGLNRFRRLRCRGSVVLSRLLVGVVSRLFLSKRKLEILLGQEKAS